MPVENNKLLVLQWNQLLLDAIRCSNTSPPLAARAMAIVHTAMYDAWSVYDPCAISVSTSRYIKILNGADYTRENKRKAYSYAAYRTLSDLFCFALPAENKDMFRNFMCKLNYDPEDKTLDIDKPQGIGNLMARLTIESRNGDGTNPLGTLRMPAWSDYTGYQPVNSPDRLKDLNHWQPLKTETASGEFKTQTFLTPQWGTIKPFALKYQWQFRPDPPIYKHESKFLNQVKQVMDLSAFLTDEQKAIAEYWADGPGTYTPPGHWCEIAQFVADKEGYGTSQCIKLLFALANALLDASIACWECKRHYDYVRPVTAIRALFKGKEIEAWGGSGQGKKIIKGENWQSYIATPPFPDYVSGHSTFSAAASFIFQCYTGKDKFEGCTTIKKGSSKIEAGSTPKKDIILTWPTFSCAADEAGMSRLYGGIHFMKANEEGRKLGIAVGEMVWKRALVFFND